MSSALSRLVELCRECEHFRDLQTTLNVARRRNIDTSKNFESYRIFV